MTIALSRMFWPAGPCGWSTPPASVTSSLSSTPPSTSTSTLSSTSPGTRGGVSQPQSLYKFRWAMICIKRTSLQFLVSLSSTQPFSNHLAGHFGYSSTKFFSDNFFLAIYCLTKFCYQCFFDKMIFRIFVYNIYFDQTENCQKFLFRTIFFGNKFLFWLFLYRPNVLRLSF